ncbi:uncharacterized protein LOC124286934 [Haliotis rubra]|uniref:uncharacterized protein LOC124286934 n=1 Tax=Haliotis rubra TaxID=36100 RepID=UPI001EE595CE|nr:uncharacterized protein LOC124286934 [Haliotis rubra]
MTYMVYGSSQGCGGHFNTVTGSMTSPKYRDSRKVRLSCIYTINAGSTSITLVLEEMSTRGYLRVVDASDNTLELLYGNNTGYIMQSATYYRILYNEYEPSKGFRATWSVTTREHARYGGYATLSWNLPQPGIREFTVWNNDRGKCILHITNYNNVSIASEELSSKVKFTGNITSSGTGLMRFIITGVRWEDEGQYVCYRGPRAFRGTRISKCGQELELLGGCGGYYSAVSGSCTCSNVSCDYNGECVYIIDAGSALLTLVLDYFTTPSSLGRIKVYDVSGKLLAALQGDKIGYTLQSSTYYRIQVDCCDYESPNKFKATWSETITEHARYGGYATLSWNLPQPGIREFTVWNNSSAEYILHITNYTNVSAASEKLASRIDFIGSITPSGTALFRFVIQDVTGADAGRYECYRGSMVARGARIPHCGQELTVLGCGGHYNTPSGSFTSPNYPGEYNNSLSCIYTIDAGSTLVTLVFENFLTEKFEDFVQVYDASKNLLAYLHKNRTGYVLQSAIYYYVNFTTNDYGARKGFRATWTETITEHARYGGYATLSWNLPQPGIREFTVWNNDRGKCILHITNYNNVSIAGEELSSKVKFTGNITSSGTGLMRFIITGVRWEDEGQYVCYRGPRALDGERIPNCGQKLDVSGCGGYFSTTPGVIFSPNYPGKYGNYLTCTYIIDAGSTLVTLVFEDFLTYNSEDYVKVHDAYNNLLAHLTGNQTGYIVQSASYYNVYFNTIRFNKGNGFKARWSNTTTEHARYGGYATLSWNLPQPGIREFTVWNNSSAEYILHITNYTNASAASEKLASRIDFIGSITPSGTGLFRFVIQDVTGADAGRYECYRGSMVARGARIPHCGQELTVLGCGGFYNTTSGFFISPYVYSWYETHLPCSYTIDAGTTLVTLVLENLETHVHDVIKVYDKSHSRLAYLSYKWTRHILQSATLYRIWFIKRPRFKAAWSVTTTEHARYGGYATLSWPLPTPSVEEFTVCNSASSACLLHVTGYVDTANLSSRVRSMGRSSSSGSGQFRWLLYNVTWQDEGYYRCHRGSPGARGSVIPNCGQNLTVLTATTVYTSPGGTASFSMKLPRPGVKEFTVRRCPYWMDDLADGSEVFRVTDYSSVVTAREYESRALFTGHITSSGAGVFGFVLHNVDMWFKEGDYFGVTNQSGSGESVGGQRLVVLKTQIPYIVASYGRRPGSISLSCHVICQEDNQECPPEVSVTWRKNGVVLAEGYHKAVETWGWENNICSYYSTLYVRQWKPGERYECHGVVEHTLVSGWSEEYVVESVWPDSDTKYTVAREGNNVTLSWYMPLFGRSVSVKSPDYINLFSMELTNIFVTKTYYPRLKILGVVTLPAAVVVRLKLNNVTVADAGVYVCEQTRTPRWKHTLFVSRTPTTPIMAYSEFQQMTLLTCLSRSRTLPEDYPTRLSYRWRTEGPGREGQVKEGPSLLISKEDTGTTHLCQTDEDGAVTTWTSDRPLYELFITDLTVNDQETVVMDDNGTLRFTCRVTGYPRATVSYIVNHDNGETHALSDWRHDVTISSINSSYHGQYTCAASNMMGVTHGDDHPVFVKVKSSPVRMDSDTDSLTVRYNKHDMTGTFVIRAYPEPKFDKMYFSRNENTIVDISNRQRPKLSVVPVKDNLFRFTFTITRVLKAELGTYKVSIGNEMGSVDVFIRLLDGDTGATKRNLYVIMSPLLIVLAAIVLLSVFLLPRRRQKKPRVSSIPPVTDECMGGIGLQTFSPSDSRDVEAITDDDGVQHDTAVGHQGPN